MTTNNFKLDTYFAIQYAEALKAEKRFIAMGEYNWARDWKKYAAAIYGYAQKYQELMEAAKYNRSRGIAHEDPPIQLPLQPMCLSNITENDGTVTRVQLKSVDYRRPPMYQSVGRGIIGGKKLSKKSRL